MSLRSFDELKLLAVHLPGTPDRPIRIGVVLSMFDTLPAGFVGQDFGTAIELLPIDLEVSSSPSISRLTESPQFNSGFDAVVIDALMADRPAESDYEEIPAPPEHGATFEMGLLEFRGYGRMLFLADLSGIENPDENEMAEIVRRGVEVLSRFGYSEPKVSLLAAVEVASPGMPVTVIEEKAAALLRTAGVIVEGPLSFDLSVSPHAAEKKKAKGPVAGKADLLIAPNRTVARSIYDAVVFAAEAKAVRVRFGGKLPVVIPGSDDSDVKRAAILTAAVVSRIQH